MNRADAHKYFLNMMGMLNVVCLAGEFVILAQRDDADAVNDAKQYFIPVQCLIDLLGRAAFAAYDNLDSPVTQAEPLLGTEAPARGILDTAFAVARFGQVVSWTSASSTVNSAVATGIAGLELLADAARCCVKPGRK
jgi:hypothetical protein